MCVAIELVADPVGEVCQVQVEKPTGREKKNSEWMFEEDGDIVIGAQHLPGKPFQVCLGLEKSGRRGWSFG